MQTEDRPPTAKWSLGKKRREVRREKVSLRLVVSKWPLYDGLQQRLRPEGHRWGCFGAGVWLPALLVTHGFYVAAAPHPAAGYLLLFATCGVRTPIVLRHLGKNRDSPCQSCPLRVCVWWFLEDIAPLAVHHFKSCTCEGFSTAFQIQKGSQYEVTDFSHCER